MLEAGNEIKTSENKVFIFSTFIQLFLSDIKCLLLINSNESRHKAPNTAGAPHA